MIAVIQFEFSLNEQLENGLFLIGMDCILDVIVTYNLPLTW